MQISYLCIKGMNKYLTASKLFFFCNEEGNFYSLVDGSNFPTDLIHCFPVMTSYCVALVFPFKVIDYQTCKVTQ